VPRSRLDDVIGVGVLEWVDGSPRVLAVLFRCPIAVDRSVCIAVMWFGEVLGDGVVNS
jgi:hypothetical protein